LFLFCAVVSISADFSWNQLKPGDCDGAVSSWLTPGCYGKCVQRKDPVGVLSELLEEKFFGQHHIIPEIIKMFRTYQSGSGVITFHMAGDYGSGKSYIVQIFREALFQYDGDGFLMISGVNYKGNTNEEVFQFRQNLVSVITNQLERCPNSIIIIDDVHYIHASTLLALIPFFDPTSQYITKMDGKKVFKNKAIFGLISDFLNFEVIYPGIKMSTMEGLMKDEASKYWDNDPRQTSLIQYNFPFTPLNKENIRQIVEYNITKAIPTYFSNKKISKIYLSDDALNQITDTILQENPNGNGRGAVSWIRKHILPKMNEISQTNDSPVIVRMIKSNQKSDKIEYQTTILKPEL